jgi:hypothetical protein
MARPVLPFPVTLPLPDKLRDTRIEDLRFGEGAREEFDRRL